MTVQLRPLVGTNALGFLAALGVVAALDRRTAGSVRLSWSDSVVPRAVLHGWDGAEAVVSALEEDRTTWGGSLVLYGGPDGKPIADVKVLPGEAASWSARIAAATSPADRRDADLICALIAEGATAGKGDVKPTHLHFTAGQQRFLTMVRELREGIGPADFAEAIVGPWRYESPLPVLGWDTRGERIFALRGLDPAKEKRLGVPAAEWLAFMGLAFIPVANRHGELRTAGCSSAWKRGTFRWPLWSVPLSPPVIRSLLSYGAVETSDVRLRLRGVERILEAPIRRSDQGGYGSIGPPSDVGGSSTPAADLLLD